MIISQNKIHPVFGAVVPEDVYIKGIPAGVTSEVVQSNEEFALVKLTEGDSSTTYYLLYDEVTNTYLISSEFILCRNVAYGYPSIFVRMVTAVLHPVWVLAYPIRKMVAVFVADYKSYRKLLNSKQTN